MGCELNGPNIAFPRLLDDPDLVWRVLEEEAAHIGHYVPVARLNLEYESLA